MNFLAHLFLSEPDIEPRLGNLLGDFVKGRVIEELSEEARRGVLLHRRIDAFTDAHPMVLRSIERVRPEWGRFSPILVDVFYDFFLTRRWEHYTDVPLRDFLDGTYDAYRCVRPGLHECFVQPMDRLIASDRMSTYGTVAGIEAALDRLSRRFRRNQISLAPAAHCLNTLGDGLEEDFAAFFPELIGEVRSGSRDLK